jgi:hypothetical protein
MTELGRKENGGLGQSKWGKRTFVLHRAAALDPWEEFKPRERNSRLAAFATDNYVILYSAFGPGLLRHCAS